MKTPFDSASSYYAPPQNLQHDFRGVLRLLLLLTGLACIASPALAVRHSRWSEHYELGNTPVHMVLSPAADGTSHSRLVWWRGYDPLGPSWGGFVDWTPVTDTAYVSWPAANLSFSPSNTDYSPGTFDVFCAGHSHVAAGGGRILVSGGTSTIDGEVGMTHNLLLDPATMTWDSTSVANMQGRRW